MHSATVKQTLRPLKFAYIVRPNDLKALQKVIETNAFLWGGKYNPVITLYKKRPTYLSNFKKSANVDEIMQGSLKFYEPDFIVLTGDINKDEIKNPTCEIISLSDIYKGIAKEGMPSYGIGLGDILREYYSKEHKFVRKNKTHHVSAKFKLGNNCFLKALFGCFPDELSEFLKSDIFDAFEIEEVDINLNNYLSVMADPEVLNIHQLESYKLELDYRRNVNRDKHVILVLDPKKYIDIVDFINVRASGSSVYPVTVNILQSKSTKEACVQYIEDVAWVHPDNHHATHPVTMQCGRSVSKSKFENFYKSLNIPNFEGRKFSKCTLSSVMPNYWDTRWQDKGRVTCSNYITEVKESEVLLDGDTLKTKSIAPSFISERIPKAYKPRYANDISVSSYSSTAKEFGADIYPTNSPEIARAAGLHGFNEWIIKPSTLTKLCRSEDALIFVQIQNAEKIFLSWLKSEGWEARISDAGKVAYQMLRQLGGPWGITFLKGKKLIKFLVGKNDDPLSEQLVQSATGINNRVFRAKALEAYNDHHVFWGEDKFIKHFLEHNIFKLGTSLQCDVCSRRSWHAIDRLKYIVDCPHCLDSFNLPSHSPDDIKWSYTTIGPFAAAGKAAGAYCVLLTASFFNDRSAMDSSTTTVLSFEAEKEGVKIEADLGLFYRKNSNFERTTELIFAECKIYRNFTAKDITKMKIIAKAFPNSILVFATLNEKLTAKEKLLLSSFVKQCNKEGKNGRPKNPVMILTATELCTSQTPPYCWKNLGGRYEPYKDAHYIRDLLEISQATQKIYLDIGSWYEGWR